MSSARHDKCIDMVIQEANDIGTAILRADLYPDSLRNPMRSEFKKLSLTSSFILGYSGGAKNDWVISISFTIMISMAIFMILDLDRPRTGIITSKDANIHMLALRDMFK